MRMVSCQVQRCHGIVTPDVNLTQSDCDLLWTCCLAALLPQPLVINLNAAPLVDIPHGNRGRSRHRHSLKKSKVCNSSSAPHGWHSFEYGRTSHGRTQSQTTPPTYHAMTMSPLLTAATKVMSCHQVAKLPRMIWMKITMTWRCVSCFHVWICTTSYDWACNLSPA